MDQLVTHKESESEHKSLADRLAAALREEEFVLYGQKIVSLVANPDERPFQEILIRFQEEEAKLLPPGSFFPILEECGLLPFVDRWVVSRITLWSHLAQTIRPECKLPNNSINLSTTTLSDQAFIEHTRRHLHAAALPALTLSFEVTCDSALEQFKGLQNLMAHLRPHGCGFVLARFDGSKGAFELLRKLAPEFVKLSPGLVRALGQGSTGLSRVDAINRECHRLGIKTIAEHVESDQTITQLRMLGVDFGQGFAIQSPQRLA